MRLLEKTGVYVCLREREIQESCITVYISYFPELKSSRASYLVHQLV